ncbi:MAG: YjfB family protein [Bacillota bacterium]
MDAAARSTIMEHQQLMYDSSIKTAGMAKDQMEQQGENILKLLGSTEINQSSHPHKGQNVDISVY